MLKTRRLSLFALAVSVAACGSDAPPPEPTPAPAAAAVVFTEVGAASGLDRANVSGSPEQGYILETISAGAAFLDYDGDGFQDLFLVSGTRLEDPPADAIHRLYRNVPAQSRRVFADVSDEVGLAYGGWGMGAAVADYDNDGDPDLYVTHWGPNLLLRNEAGARFAQMAPGSAAADPGWGTSATFGDLDQDGRVDLYVVNYLEFDLDDPPAGWLKCRYKGLESFCGPEGIAPQADALYRNTADGGFVDMSAAVGLDQVPMPGLGVALLDHDNDGDLDIYVANDSEPNQLFRNDGDWRFVEIGARIGLAYSENGRAQAGMGVHAADYDNDGDADLYVTNFSDDVNTLYRNDGEAGFADATFAADLGGLVRPYLGWGTVFFDYDNDGWLDLAVANGHVYPQLARHASGLSYAQRNLLYRNQGGRFTEVGPQAGAAWAQAKSSRAAALADYDNDGDTDLLVTNLNDTPSLLRNDGGNVHPWIGLQLVGKKSNRDAIGARVKLRAGGGTQTRHVQRGYGFQAQHDVRLLFGLGIGPEMGKPLAKVDEVEILWPSGRVQTLKDLPLRRYIRVREGDDALAAGPEVPPAPAASPVPRPQQAAAPALPENPAWTAKDYRRVGQQYYSQGRYAEARAALQKALQLQPDHVQAQVNLGLVLYSGLGLYDEAIALLENTVRQAPDFAPAHHLLGKAYLRHDAPQKAVAALKRAVQLNNGAWEYSNWLGLAYARVDSQTAAAAAWQRAARAAPWEPRPHLHLARLYERQADQANSQRHWDLFRRLNPVQQQVDLYRRKIVDHPDNPRGHTLLGFAYAEQGRWQAALRQFDAAIAADSLFAPAHHGRGRILQGRGNLQEAIKSHKRACILDPALTDAYNDLGQIYHQVGRYDLAVQAYQRSLAQRPDLALVHANLGMAYAQMGRLAAAIAAFDNSIQRDPNAADTRDALAQVYAADGRLKEAIAQWEEVLRLAPDHPRALQGIQRARQLLDRAD